MLFGTPCISVYKALSSYLQVPSRWLCSQGRNALLTAKTKDGRRQELERYKKLAEQHKLYIGCRPISNHVLGLRPFVKDVVVHKLMDQKIPCGLRTIRRCSDVSNFLCLN